MGKRSDGRRATGTPQDDRPARTYALRVLRAWLAAAVCVPGAVFAWWFLSLQYQGFLLHPLGGPVLALTLGGLVAAWPATRSRAAWWFVPLTALVVAAGGVTAFALAVVEQRPASVVVLWAAILGAPLVLAALAVPGHPRWRGVAALAAIVVTAVAVAATHPVSAFLAWSAENDLEEAYRRANQPAFVPPDELAGGVDLHRWERQPFHVSYDVTLPDAALFPVRVDHQPHECREENLIDLGDGLSEVPERGFTEYILCRTEGGTTAQVSTRARLTPEQAAAVREFARSLYLSDSAHLADVVRAAR